MLISIIDTLSLRAVHVARNEVYSAAWVKILWIMFIEMACMTLILSVPGLVSALFIIMFFVANFWRSLTERS